MSKKTTFVILILLLGLGGAFYWGNQIQKKRRSSQRVSSQGSVMKKYLSKRDYRLLNNSDSNFFRRRQVFGRLRRGDYQSLTPDTIIKIVRESNRRLGPNSLFRCDAELVKAKALNQKINQTGSKEALARRLEETIDNVIKHCRRVSEKTEGMKNPSDLLENYAPLIGNLYRDFFKKEPQVIQNKQLELSVLKLLYPELQKQYQTVKKRLGSRREEEDWIDERLSDYESDLKKVERLIKQIKNSQE